MKDSGPLPPVAWFDQWLLWTMSCRRTSAFETCPWPWPSVVVLCIRTTDGAADSADMLDDLRRT